MAMDLLAPVPGGPLPQSAVILAHDLKKFAAFFPKDLERFMISLSSRAAVGVFVGMKQDGWRLASAKGGAVYIMTRSDYLAGLKLQISVEETPGFLVFLRSECKNARRGRSACRFDQAIHGIAKEASLTSKHQAAALPN
jgi:hypothetical protein